MLRRVGMVVGLLGSAIGLVGCLWNILVPTADANIGAGALVVAGLVMCAGATALVCLRIVMGRGGPRRRDAVGIGRR